MNNPSLDSENAKCSLQNEHPRPKLFVLTTRFVLVENEAMSKQQLFKLAARILRKKSTMSKKLNN